MSRVLRNGLALLRAPATELGFAMRSVLQWSRGEPRLPASAKGSTFGWADMEQRPVLEKRAERLLTAFDLQPLAATASPAVRCQNLARLDRLEALSHGLCLPVATDGVVRAADFGCGDFHYAAALQQWLARHQAALDSAETDLAPGPPVAGDLRRVVLRGIELDGYGIYRDGHSRADYARARAKFASVAGSLVQFEVADASQIRLPAQDVVTLFFPFLTSYACLRWGAPLSRLRPRRLLLRAVQSLRPGGWLVVVNQTPREHMLLTRLLADQPLVRLARTSFATDMVPAAEQTRDQVGSLWLRQD